MEKYYGWGLPIDVSTHGAAIDRLIVVVHAFMAVLFIGWTLFMVIALLRFRARQGHRAVHHAGHFAAPTYLEAAVALFEVFLLFAFAFPIWSHVKSLPPREGSLQVRVVAEQFAWNIHYSGNDGVFGKTDTQLVSPSNPLGLDGTDPAAKDDITTINQFHVPVDIPVTVTLSSKDVIHSFGIPVMRVKQDTIPGERIPVWFQAKRTGNFEIACGQLCGLGHYRMRGYFIVDSAENFRAWLDGELAKKTA